MAINQEAIVSDAVTKLVAAVSSICDSLDAIEAIQEQLSQQPAPIDLEDFEALIEAGAGIQHCDAATYKNILSAFAPHVVTELKAYYDGSPTQQGWAAFMKARK
jgi:hypothetical protein